MRNKSEEEMQKEAYQDYLDRFQCSCTLLNYQMKKLKN